MANKLSEVKDFLLLNTSKSSKGRLGRAVSYTSGIYIVNILVNGGSRNIRLVKLQK